MDINKLLKEKGLTKYRLAVLSGVPHATLNNICSGQAHIEKCSAETLYKLARVLGVTIEDLIEDAMEREEREKRRLSFDLFKSNVCHRVKDEGDIQFVVEILKTNEIRRYYERKEYAQAFYLLAMVDYLSREIDIRIVHMMISGNRSWRNRFTRKVFWPWQKSWKMILSWIKVWSRLYLNSDISI